MIKYTLRLNKNLYSRLMDVAKDRGMIVNKVAGEIVDTIMTLDNIGFNINLVYKTNMDYTQLDKNQRLNIELSEDVYNKILFMESFYGISLDSIILLHLIKLETV